MLIVTLFLLIAVAFTGYLVFADDSKKARPELEEESMQYAMNAYEGSETAVGKADIHTVKKHFGTYDGTTDMTAYVDAGEASFTALLFGGKVVEASRYAAYIDGGVLVLTIPAAGLERISSGMYCFNAELSDGLSETIWLIVPNKN
ncbi:MAG: hypothetical protein LBR14_03035 [Clostridiales Family XIII bacterium]|jgi:hypothetical protein|nr:hypothetical protein [Clostridiales Family XIII bacterium]